MSYKKKVVSIQQLFDTGKVRVSSVDALRYRASKGLIVYVDSIGPLNRYDKQLSIILLEAATRCRRPPRNWGQISRIIKDLNISSDFMIEQLNKGTTEEELIESIVKMIESKL